MNTATATPGARVENMTNARGNKAPNQFIIETDAGLFFQSYQSAIAFKPLKGKTQLDAEKWDYSATTGRFRNQFLNEGIAETRAKIASGEYILTNLNR